MKIMSNYLLQNTKKDVPVPIPGSCQFFVVRKKRYCRMLVKGSEKYCCEHQPTDVADVSEGKVRIPCPLDNKHTCYADKLEKHLRICNARPKKFETFIVKGINAGSSPGISYEENHEKNDLLSLSSKPSSEIRRVIDRVNKIYEEQQIRITEKILSHEVVENEMKNEIYGNKTKKHLKQVSSILGLISEHKLFNSNTCYIEFGAGRGALSYWISKAMSNDSSILLIEKASPKHKKDNKLDKSSEKVKRIRADICDLVLDELDLVNQSDYVVGVTKHLCGAATDFTLRCLANSSKNKHKLAGFLMTFCCHHRCSWSSFTGRTYFEEIGLFEEEFRIMCGMVSWATCGTGFSRERRANLPEGADLEPKVNKRDSHGLTANEKEDIGHKCKNLMNWGRLKFINDAGFDGILYYYVKSDVTPENVCIVARNKGLV